MDEKYVKIWIEKEAMEYEIIEHHKLENISNFVKEITAERDSSHGYQHMYEVACLADEIAVEIVFTQTFMESVHDQVVQQLLKPDGKFHDEIEAMFSLPVLRDHIMRVIVTCALVHDVIDHKYAHPAGAENRLKEVLEKEIPVKHCVSFILHIIDNISYSKEVRDGYPDLWSYTRFWHTVRDIVSDADKITALGHDGLKRCWIYQKHVSPHDTDEQILEKVVQHCHDKLLRLLPHFIRTDKGKALAQKGHNEIEEFVASPYFLNES